MRKISIATIIVALLFFFTGCTVTGTGVDVITNPLRSAEVDYIGEILDAASGENSEGISAEVRDGIKNLKLKRVEDTIQISSKDLPTFSVKRPEDFDGWKYKNVKECSIISKDVIELEKNRIINFIEATDFFVEKEELKDYIRKIPFYEGIPDEKDYLAKASIAVYSAEDEAIYVCTKNEDLIREMADHIIAHELMHALCTRCNGGDSNKRYPTGIWDEIMTDMLVTTLDCYQSNSYASLYTQYFEFGLRAVKGKGEKIIKAYFYGYDEFSPNELKELDAFAYAINVAGWPTEENGMEMDEEQTIAISLASLIALKWTL